MRFHFILQLASYNIFSLRISFFLPVCLETCRVPAAVGLLKCPPDFLPPEMCSVKRFGMPKAPRKNTAKKLPKTRAAPSKLKSCINRVSENKKKAYTSGEPPPINRFNSSFALLDRGKTQEFKPTFEPIPIISEPRTVLTLSKACNESNHNARFPSS